MHPDCNCLTPMYWEIGSAFRISRFNANARIYSESRIQNPESRIWHFYTYENAHKNKSEYECECQKLTICHVSYINTRIYLLCKYNYIQHVLQVSIKFWKSKHSFIRKEANIFSLRFTSWNLGFYYYENRLSFYVT